MSTDIQVVRRESPEEACEMDKKMLWAWKSHQNHYKVVNSEGITFQNKIKQVCDLVLAIAEEKHPQGQRNSTGTSQ